MENIIEANKNNVIQFGFNFRHSDMFIKLQEEMELDEIKYLHITSYAAKPQSRMWNCRTVLESSLLASHIHAIEMVCYILGEIKEISRKISWIDDKRFIGTILLKNKEGRVGVIDISNLHNKFEFNLESVDSKNKHFIAQNFNHIETYDDVFIDKNNKSNISYDIPFLRGGFSRTGYSREFDNFAKNISLKKSDDKALVPRSEPRCHRHSYPSSKEGYRSRLLRPTWSSRCRYSEDRDHAQPGLPGMSYRYLAYQR